MTVAPRYAPYAGLEATGLAAPLLLPPECSQRAVGSVEQDDWWSSNAVFHRWGLIPASVVVLALPSPVPSALTIWFLTLC